MRGNHKRAGAWFGLCCMVLGALMLLGALSLLLWNQWEGSQAEQASQQVLEQVKEEIPAGDSTDSQPSNTQIIVSPSNSGDTTMKEVEIDGALYIGYLSIPVLDLELPVQSQWDYPSLKISPCRYYGSTKSDDLVIAAHNYARHFGTLNQLLPGDLVYFTDMEGTVSLYQVVEVDILEPTAVEEMTDGGYDLTLFTCTYGGKSRVTVRCLRAEETGTQGNETSK